MRIVVLTSNGYRHLVKDFATLFNNFWSPDRKVTMFGFKKPDEELPDNFIFISPGEDNQPWSDQLIAVCNTIKDDYFILMKEDFYLMKPVSLAYLAECERFAEENKVARFSLQSVKDGYENCSEGIYDSILGVPLFKLKNTADYICSFEASVFSRDFLLKYLIAGENSPDAENNTSARVRDAMQKGEAHKVIVPLEKVLHYEDAMRGGDEVRIKKIDNELYVLKGAGWLKTDIKV